MDAWVKWTNYGIQVGDFTESRKYISNDFTEELEGYKSFEDLYKRGGWIIDGIDNYVADGNPWSEDGGKLFLEGVSRVELYNSCGAYWASGTETSISRRITIRGSLS